MALRLKDPKMLPKDGFWFAEAGRTFNEMFSFNGKKALILTFRKDNNLPRATDAEVDEDLQNVTCNRDPSLCYDPNNLPGAATYQSAGYGRTGCAGCGGQRA